MLRKTILIYCALFCVNIAVWAQTTWINPIQKQGRFGSPLVETSPFVFNDNLYLLENNQRFWDVPGAKPGDHYEQDEVRIRHLESGKIVSVPLKNHGFGTVLTWGDRVYVFAGSYGSGKPWRQMTEITMTSSKDLKNWSTPKTILKASGKEYFFNTAVCRGKDKFILLYETNDDRWKPFTFRYVESSDLENWTEIPEAVYGKSKYVGGPALYFEGGWYYTLYLESIKGGYETRITRSQDLIAWEDAPKDRPFVTFDPSHRNIPLIDSSIAESNASDVELCYYNGKTILYFTGSDQTTAGDLQWATYNGTPRQLFEHFYSNNDNIETPRHEGNWAPVLIAPEGKVDWQKKPTTRRKPNADQLAYQENPLGAFIHFGPATYIESDMLSVPPVDIFNPVKLDAEQWVKAAKSFGAKSVVLTAKHHNGFCLWPTRTTDYSVKNSPWKNGKGDVVAEFVAACKKYDMKVGLYVSTGDKHFGCTSTPDPQGQRKLVGDIDKYFPVFFEQLRELLTNYGEVSYLWFDGAYNPLGWDVMDPKTMKPLGTAYGDAIRTLVKHLQPNALVMGGTKPDVRWSGSEQGWAPYPLWNVVEQGEGFEKWVGPQNHGWLPAEACMHTRSSWFWKTDSDKTLRDIPYLFNAYLESIGRGANLLINMTPDTSGLIPDMEVSRLAELGETLENVFGEPVGSKTKFDEAPANQHTIHLDKKRAMNLLVIEEDIQHGQTISDYQVEVFAKGKWIKVAEGQTIGRKRIQLIEAPVKTGQVRLSLSTREGEPRLKSFSLYHADLEKLNLRKK
ncbi:MAG: alpha-L-fucosidase [Cyclobacteriaceae bacterium]